MLNSEQRERKAAREVVKKIFGGVITQCQDCGNDELGLVAAHRDNRDNNPMHLDLLCPVHEVQRHWFAALDGEDNGLTPKENFHTARAQALALDENGKGWLRYFLGRDADRLLRPRRRRTSFDNEV